MDDPWLNAWRDDQKPSLSSTWSSSNNVTDDQADITVPSWAPESPNLWSSNNAPVSLDVGILPTEQESVANQETSSDSGAVGNQGPSEEVPADTDGPTTEDTPDPWTLPQVEGRDWVDSDDVARNEDPESLDEWELAKRQKELQDRYVVRRLYP